LTLRTISTMARVEQAMTKWDVCQRSRRGLVAVEFALVLPMLLTICFIAVDFA
jgi:Flp pilus assembly protein TadG